MITAITRTTTKIVPTKPKPMAASIRLSSLDPWVADTQLGDHQTPVWGEVWFPSGCVSPDWRWSRVDNQLRGEQ
jgi:hypothetical protein